MLNEDNYFILIYFIKILQKPIVAFNIILVFFIMIISIWLVIIKYISYF